MSTKSGKKRQTELKQFEEMVLYYIEQAQTVEGKDLRLTLFVQNFDPRTRGGNLVPFGPGGPHFGLSLVFQSNPSLV
jgi:hypothetical protein